MRSSTRAPGTAAAWASPNAVSGGPGAAVARAPTTFAGVSPVTDQQQSHESLRPDGVLTRSDADAASGIPGSIGAQRTGAARTGARYVPEPHDVSAARGRAHRKSDAGLPECDLVGVKSVSLRRAAGLDLSSPPVGRGS